MHSVIWKVVFLPPKAGSMVYLLRHYSQLHFRYCELETDRVKPQHVFSCPPFQKLGGCWRSNLLGCSRAVSRNYGSITATSAGSARKQGGCWLLAEPLDPATAELGQLSPASTHLCVPGKSLLPLRCPKSDGLQLSTMIVQGHAWWGFKGLHQEKIPASG